MYNHAASGGLLGKLAWWHDHIWSLEETWYRASVIWVTKLKPQDLSLNDFDRCVTHLANTFEADNDFYYQVFGCLSLVANRTGGTTLTDAFNRTTRSGLSFPSASLYLSLWQHDGGSGAPFPEL